MEKRYIVVTGSATKPLDRYLYTHTTVEHQQTFAVAMLGLRTYYLLRTEAPWANESVDYLVGYQADRLESGSFRATVYLTRDEAVAALAKHEVYL